MSKSRDSFRTPQSKTPRVRGVVALHGCLTMTYFRTGSPYYHRRAAVSRSCSGWEGVGPAGYGRQALRVAFSAEKRWKVRRVVLHRRASTVMESSRTGH